MLAGLKPQLAAEETVFCTVAASLAEVAALSPLGTFREAEGLTVILPKDTAIAAGLPFEGVFRAITLTVHSSLNAVGLTAAVSSALAERGISANVVAAFYHDHIFVPADKAEAALEALHALAGRPQK